MKMKKTFREVKHIVLDIEKIAKDENAAANLSAWMSGYLERSKMEKRIRERMRQ